MVNVNEPPEAVEPVDDRWATENVAFSFSVAASTFRDPDAGDALDYAATLDDGRPLPAWLAFDAAPRTFSGRAGFADAGPWAILVRPRIAVRRRWPPPRRSC